jgi:hypothetical protein
MLSGHFKCRCEPFAKIPLLEPLPFPQKCFCKFLCLGLQLLVGGDVQQFTTNDNSVTRYRRATAFCKCARVPYLMSSSSWSWKLLACNSASLVLTNSILLLESWRAKFPTLKGTSANRV